MGQVKTIWLCVVFLAIFFAQKRKHLDIALLFFFNKHALSRAVWLLHCIPTDGQTVSVNVCSLAEDGLWEQVSCACSVCQRIYKKAEAKNKHT